MRAACALIAAVLSGAVVDAITELSANTGALGDAARDAHQEGIVPALLLGALLLIATCATVALGARSSLLAAYRSTPVWERVFFAVGTIALCLGTIVAIEAYESQFGAAQAFDLTSVYAVHLPLVVLMCAVIAPLVGALVRASLRAASSAGLVALALLAWFRNAEGTTLGALAHRVARRFLRAVHSDLLRARGAIALRAPPPHSMLTLLHAS